MEKLDFILHELADIKRTMLAANKNVLTVEEAAEFTGLKKASIYKLTMQGKIPHYKPTGKMCYFNRADLEAWLQTNRVASSAEISERAQKYCASRKGGAV